MACLSACAYEDIFNPFESQRPEQYVTGARRPPVLNGATQSGAVQNSNAQQSNVVYSSASNSVPKSSVTTDPFDNYNENSYQEDISQARPYPTSHVNAPAISTVPTTSTPASEPTTSSQGTMLSRFIDSFGNANKTNYATVPEVRKPLPGNPHYSKETEETAPVQPAAIDSGRAYPEGAVVHWNPGQNSNQKAIAAAAPEEHASTPAPVQAPMPTPVADAEPEEKPVPLALRAPEPEAPVRTPPVQQQASAQENIQDNGPAFPENAIIRWHGNNTVNAAQPAPQNTPASAQPSNSEPAPVTLQEKPAAQDDSEKSDKPAWTKRWLGEDKPASELPPVDPELQKPYPALSSVPQTPEEFKAVKTDKDKDMNSLEHDYDAAQDAKKSLDAEPSKQPRPAPTTEEPLPSNDRAPLLGGGTVPPPPFMGDLPKPTFSPEENKDDSDSFFDRIGSAFDSTPAKSDAAHSMNPPDATPNAATSGSNVDSGAGQSGLPSPEILDQVKPHKSDSQ